MKMTTHSLYRKKHDPVLGRAVRVLTVVVGRGRPNRGVGGTIGDVTF